MTVCKNSLRLSLLTAVMSVMPVIVGILLSPGTLFAGEGGLGHSHSKTPKTESEIKKTAEAIRDRLIKDGKISDSWRSVAVSEAAQKEFKKGKEWVVSFKDSNATDKTKEVLYLFFSLNGNFLASNFTGK